MHLAQAALGVEGGHFQVVAVQVEGAGDVVADHVEPGHLFFVEFLAGAAVVLHDPALEVFADGGGVGGQGLVQTADPADQGHQGGQFAERAFALVLVGGRKPARPAGGPAWGGPGAGAPVVR